MRRRTEGSDFDRAESAGPCDLVIAPPIRGCKIEVNSSIGLLQALDFDNQTIERARAEFFRKLKSPDGFVGFYLVADENGGVNTVVIVWESKEAAEAFDTVSDVWQGSLEGNGSRFAKRESWRNDDSDRRFALTTPQVTRYGVGQSA